MTPNVPMSGYNHQGTPSWMTFDTLYKIATLIALGIGSWFAAQVDLKIAQLRQDIQHQMMDSERRMDDRFLNRRDGEVIENRLDRLETGEATRKRRPYNP